MKLLISALFITHLRLEGLSTEGRTHCGIAPAAGGRKLEVAQGDHTSGWQTGEASVRDPKNPINVIYLDLVASVCLLA